MLSSTQTSKYSFTPLPEEVLEVADKITLGDVLECCYSNGFILSAISNSVKNQRKLISSDKSTDTQTIKHLLYLNSLIPPSIKAENFTVANSLIKERNVD
jgi:hypothetical protein